jgi:hypothetical protein
VPGVRLARERAKDLAYALGANQRGEPGVAVAGVVVDDGEPARALRDQGVDEGYRHARATEAADHDRGPVADVGERRFGAGKEFIDHGAEIMAFAYSSYGTFSARRKPLI